MEMVSFFKTSLILIVSVDSGIYKLALEISILVTESEHNLHSFVNSSKSMIF